jgi:AraC-like DNA-binding protein
MAKTTMFLTKMPKAIPAATGGLARMVSRLGRPADPVMGLHGAPLVLPGNILCFQHGRAEMLNQPQHGRALHHRFVLMFALRTAATVCVDDRRIRLKAGHGLLVLPFQFHHYVQPAKETLRWLFLTFEVSDPELLEPLRFRPFTVTAELRAVLAQCVAAYQTPEADDLVVLLLALLLARLRRLDPAAHRVVPPTASPELLTQVNLLAQKGGDLPRVDELAERLGISASHLRTRFRASCGVSLGRHLRRLRLEKACGMLRLSRDRVSEIAEACGFNSLYAFSRAFRVAYGMSPLAYRRPGGATGRGVVLLRRIV